MRPRFILQLVLHPGRGIAQQPLFKLFNHHSPCCLSILESEDNCRMVSLFSIIITSVTLSHKKVYPKNCIKNYMELVFLSGPLTNTYPPFSIRPLES